MSEILLEHLGPNVGLSSSYHNTDVGWRLQKLITNVCGKYTHELSDRTVTVSMRIHEGGTEVILCVYADKELNSLILVHRVLVDERYVA